MQSSSVLLNQTSWLQFLMMENLKYGKLKRQRINRLMLKCKTIEFIELINWLILIQCFILVNLMNWSVWCLFAIDLFVEIAALSVFNHLEVLVVQLAPFEINDCISLSLILIFIRLLQLIKEPLQDRWLVIRKLLHLVHSLNVVLVSKQLCDKLLWYFVTHRL